MEAVLFQENYLDYPGFGHKILLSAKHTFQFGKMSNMVSLSVS